MFMPVSSSMLVFVLTLSCRRFNMWLRGRQIQSTNPKTPKLQKCLSVEVKASFFMRSRVFHWTNYEAWTFLGFCSQTWTVSFETCPGSVIAGIVVFYLFILYIFPKSCIPVFWLRGVMLPFLEYLGFHWIQMLICRIKKEIQLYSVLSTWDSMFLSGFYDWMAGRRWSFLLL